MNEADMPKDNEFDFDELNPGMWFDYGESGMRVCLRTCPIEEIREVEKVTTKKKRIFKGEHMHIIETVDEDQQSVLIWDYTIIDWEKCLDKSRKDIPCTRQFKVQMMNKSIKFAAFYAQSMKELNKRLMGGDDEEIKNL